MEDPRKKNQKKSKKNPKNGTNVGLAKSKKKKIICGKMENHKHGKPMTRGKPIT